MSNIPTDIKYAASHEWARNNGDGTITIGISDHAQAELGDLVYVELPEPGVTLTAGNHCAVVESTKAASDVYCPVSGEVVTVNENLNDNPELVNQDPYGDGWLLKINSSDDLSSLLDAGSYEDAIAAEN